MAIFSLNLAQLPRALTDGKPFALSDIDFRVGVDWQRPFIPDELTHFFHTESFDLFSPADRLLYNQVTGLALCEQFIFLEEMILKPVVQSLLTSRAFLLSPALREYLKRFIAEEDKHAEMFWRLLETAAPERYPERRLRYAAVPWRKELSLKLFTRFPGTFVAWIWMAMLFEERTIDISRRYRAAAGIEPLFKRAHFLHMLEESQHVELDKLLLETVYERCSPAVRAFNARIFRRIMIQYSAPQRTPLAALREVVAARPELARHMPKFLADLAVLRLNPGYQRHSYSRAALPTTFAYLDRYPEMAVMADALAEYVPPRRHGAALAGTEGTR